MKTKCIILLTNLVLIRLDQTAIKEKNKLCPVNLTKTINICYIVSTLRCPYYDSKNANKSLGPLMPESNFEEKSKWSVNYICAYSNILNSTNTSHCQLFHHICTSGTNRDTRNCHCRNVRAPFFFKLPCDKKSFDETVCRDCEYIFKNYEQPSLVLHYNDTRPFSMLLEIKSHLKLLPVVNESLVDCYADGLHLTPNDLVKHNETDTHLYYYVSLQEQYIDRYWCEALEILSNEVRKLQSNILKAPRQNEHLMHLNNKTRKVAYYYIETCPEDITRMSDFELTWEETPVGSTVTCRELCLQNDTEPVTRTCLLLNDGDISWSAVQGKCVKNSSEIFGSTYTTFLHQLSQSKDNSQKKLEQLKQLVKKMKNLVTVDAYFVAKIFENITHSPDKYSINDLIEVASEFMEFNKEILRKAQLTLNSTDKVLYSIDNALVMHNFYLDSPSKFSKKCFHIKTRNIYIQVSDIHDYNITGAAFYENNNNIEINPLFKNTDTDNLQLENLKLAAFVPETLMRSYSQYQNAKLVIVLFRRDSLFNEQNQYTTTGYQVSFYVSDSCSFPPETALDYIRILIKPNRKYKASISCTSWIYENNGICEYQSSATKGKWDTNFPEPQRIKNFFLCKYWHMTHFGLLVDNEETKQLSTITAIGCALSMLGALGVIITAVTYQTWRQNSGIKLFLNFVVTIVLENCLLMISLVVDSYKNVSACILIGSLLHYSVVVQFSWMLVIAYLQYQIYVKVFFPISKHFIIGVSIATWGLPVIPVAAVLIVNQEYYLQDNYCYLVEKPLYFYVILPVSIIFALNVFVFALILKNVCGKSIAHNRKDDFSLLHLKLIILLFFLLGLYWILGISGRFFESFALDYVFFISAALQGLILCMYFIIFNKTTRNFWLNQVTMNIKQRWLPRRKSMGDLNLDRSSRAEYP